MSDNDLIRRGEAFVVLRKAQIASCTCQIKTPDPDWHNHNCRYRILREVEAMIDHLPDAAIPAVTLPDDVAKVVGEAGRYPEILLGYSQGDMEGVMALISRQALHEAADTIRALTAIITAQAAQIAGLEAEVAKVTSDRAYIIGANAGWEAAVEQGEATPAAAALLARLAQEVGEYTLAPHLKKIVDGAKTAPQWDTQADRLRAEAAETAIAEARNEAGTGGAR